MINGNRSRTAEPRIGRTVSFGLGGRVEVEQDREAFVPRPADVNAGARESPVTGGACCPFCAATIKRKIPYNGKTSYNGKRKLAQDTLSLPHVRNLPVNSRIAGAHSDMEPGLNGHRGRKSAVGLIDPKFPDNVGAALRRPAPTSTRPATWPTPRA